MYKLKGDMKMDMKLFGLGASFVVGALLVLMNILYGTPTMFGVGIPFLYLGIWYLYDGIKYYR